MRASSAESRSEPMSERATDAKIAGAGGNVVPMHTTIKGHDLPQSGIAMSGQQDMSSIAACMALGAIAFVRAMVATGASARLAMARNATSKGRNANRFMI